MAKYVVTKEKAITMMSPIFMGSDAKYLVDMTPFLFNNRKTGMATAGNIAAWKAMEKTINMVGLCSKNRDPKANKSPITINTRKGVDWMSLGLLE